ncbi:MAG: RluA family pseudouridine synthase, partial [Clostridia bacterium]|nr:RluA family pseudouridine synthase [Clostridia bacterium]
KTRSYIQKLADEGLILVNGITKNKNHKLSEGDVVSITLPPPVETEILPENIPLNIIFEDEHLLVVDKPKGMVVHPAPSYYSGTLVNALMYHCGDSLSGINGYIRPGIVHRIDKDTSGLLIVAKSDIAHHGLAEQIAVHSFTRIYEAIVVGNIKEDSFKIDLPIGRHPTDRKKMTVIYENSKNAVTHVEVISRFGSYTHIRCKLETGRTHQIRVHMAHMGHPVLGDEVYGKASKIFPKLKGQCLLAKYISFIHPITNETLSFTAEMPDYFTKILSTLN